MANLDAQELYRRLDPSGMGQHLGGLAAQCRRAWQQALNLSLPPEYTGFGKVVVAGMGGSAVGGDLARGLAELQGRQIIVHRDYGLPAYVDAGTLVIAASYSGNTEETLSAFEAALNTPARMLAATTGGRLGTMARQGGVPAFIFDYKAPPRAALGYGFFGLLGILHKAGSLGGLGPQVEEAVAVMEGLTAEYRETIPEKSNPAKRLAGALYGKIAVIYGAGIAEAVARRWKTQINENSKAWAFFEVFPELNHNAVNGYEFPRELASSLYVLLLRSKHLHPRTLRRYEVTLELLERAGVGREILDARGDSPLAQVMSLVLLGDYTSYYLALLYGTDPTTIKAIDYLKQRLAEG